MDEWVARGAVGLLPLARYFAPSTASTRFYVSPSTSTRYYVLLLARARYYMPPTASTRNYAFANIEHPPLRAQRPSSA